MNYNTKKSKRARMILIIAAAAAVIIALGYILALNSAKAAADGHLATAWILCRPGDYVNVRRTPGKRAEEVGRLEVGDSFQTDGVSADGWRS